jgi:hypothetical protein
MNKTLKKLAIAITVIGATVTATKASAADTNTFTNVTQSLTINLVCYSNATPKDATHYNSEKAVTITTKSILQALSNASTSIPSLVGFDFGHSPQLVFLSTSTNNTIYPPVALTNFGGLATVSNSFLTNGTLAFALTPNGNPTTNDLLIPPGDTVIITNNGTNAIATGPVGVKTGTNATVAIGAGFIVSSNVLVYDSTNGNTNVAISFSTNLGTWTTLTASLFTNAGNTLTNTNVLIASFTNTATLTNVDSGIGLAVQGGTSANPTYALVGNYVTPPSTVQSSLITATGTGIGTTNEVDTAITKDKIQTYFLSIYGMTDVKNINLSLQGFAKETEKYDVLHKVTGKSTNEIFTQSSTATVNGYGNIGGTFTTNGPGASNSLDIGFFNTEYTNPGATNQAAITTGSITNPIPVVVEGTISIGSPSAKGE